MNPRQQLFISLNPSLKTQNKKTCKLELNAASANLKLMNQASCSKPHCGCVVSKITKAPLLLLWQKTEGQQLCSLLPPLAIPADDFKSVQLWANCLKCLCNYLCPVTAFSGALLHAGTPAPHWTTTLLCFNVLPTRSASVYVIWHILQA